MASFTLLNTRPARQADGLNALVASQGGLALSCPSLHIAALALPQFETSRVLSAEQAASQPSLSLESLFRVDHWVFISVNAVQHFAEALAPEWSALQQQLSMPSAPRVHAIGEATAKALINAGLPTQQPLHAQFDSESLLASEAFQSLCDAKVLILKGLGGRETLANELKIRGAQVCAWSLYERQIAPWCAEVWQRFQTQPEPMLLFSSQGSFDAFQSQIKLHEASEAWQWALQQESVVFSERIKNHCREAGWIGAIEVVPIQSDLGILHAIDYLRERRNV
ncbi:uroporphyrinogen-III synthase [Thiosulfativibrio zosterae]|uniref:Uroporphyrinogen-III synthase n=1 Tax=Thiosulfativibrio zosterae TaxID=2675053 RepID=A0A6F8PJY7_9GAMM|nr:uroporphyrinogen-III synthase [Thiosulfativibrio zosterae]BBP42374.1 hypothetical protein THMIRHAT_01200 [Thiosulfativibrio zosterae]